MLVLAPWMNTIGGRSALPPGSNSRLFSLNPPTSILAACGSPLPAKTPDIETSDTVRMIFLQEMTVTHIHIRMPPPKQLKTTARSAGHNRPGCAAGRSDAMSDRDSIDQTVDVIALH